ncbi:hypothetical protein ACIBQ1_37630 [Nonomuraea sp. NPDC050153]|uniref:hypothetical protein n=1 Tax=Nonomuraea sp. NPDC050153 TaxID=3364359 RepID=UPI0037953AF7
MSIATAAVVGLSESLRLIVGGCAPTAARPARGTTAGDHADSHRRNFREPQAGARPGQTRPDLADVVDLLRGAARVHTRRTFGAVSAGAWRDGPAVAVAQWPFLPAAALGDLGGLPSVSTSTALPSSGARPLPSPPRLP